MCRDDSIQGEGNSACEFLLWLYDEFYRLMFYTAQKYLADPSQLEEVVQESLRKQTPPTWIEAEKISETPTAQEDLSTEEENTNELNKSTPKTVDEAKTELEEAVDSAPQSG